MDGKGTEMAQLAMAKARSGGVAILASVLVLAGCGSAGSTTGATTTRTPPTATTPSSTPTPAPTPDLAHPVGLIAIGHSALTGEGTAGTFEANPDGSWATGTMSSVGSVATRMIEALPETAGHVSNQAAGGAGAVTLVAQAKAALAEVPVPALAIIDTIDNDIQCNGANVDAVTESIAKALAYVHDASPNTKILVLDQPGRPNVDYVKALVAYAPSTKAFLTWDDDCTFFDAAGNLHPEGFRKLTAVIDRYESEQFRVCALVPNCYDDGGVRRAYKDVIEYGAPPDYGHANVKGQAAMAALMWPVVQRILGL
jgi:hypothetical protein